MESTKAVAVALSAWVELAAEVLAVLTVAIGVASAVYTVRVARTLGAPLAVSGPSFRAIRPKLSHFLALEFQLAADILGTAHAGLESTG